MLLGATLRHIYRTHVSSECLRQIALNYGQLESYRDPRKLESAKILVRLDPTSQESFEA
jgi:hypothetical protein